MGRFGNWNGEDILVLVCIYKIEPVGLDFGFIKATQHLIKTEFLGLPLNLIVGRNFKNNCILPHYFSSRVGGFFSALT